MLLLGRLRRLLLYAACGRFWMRRKRFILNSDWFIRLHYSLASEEEAEQVLAQTGEPAVLPEPGLQRHGERQSPGPELASQVQPERCLDSSGVPGPLCSSEAYCVDDLDLSWSCHDVPLQLCVRVHVIIHEKPAVDWERAELRASVCEAVGERSHIPARGHMNGFSVEGLVLWFM